MSSSMRIIYLYIVSFIALTIFIFSVGYVATNIAEYMQPTIKKYELDYYNYYDYDDDYDYYDYNIGYDIMNSNNNYDSEKIYIEEQIGELQDLSRKSTFKELMSAIAVFVVSLSVYMYHWSKIQKERKEESYKKKEEVR